MGRWLVCCMILLLGSALSQAAERQRFDLNPGWNLITFQVLPADGQASKVFSGIQSGHGASLFDAGNPAQPAI